MMGSRFNLANSMVAMMPAVLAAILSFLYLGKESIWLDESYSIAFASLNWSALWSLISSLETNMSLYHYLLKVWMGLFGETEFAVRSLSAVFAVLSVSVSYAVAGRLFDRTVALVASTLLATNGFLIHFAQEARGYTLLLFLTTLSIYLFVTAVEKRKINYYIALAFVDALVLYAHFFGAFILIVQLASLLIAPRLIDWRRMIGTFAVVGLLFSPLGASVLSAPGANPWAWADEPSIRTVLAAGKALTGDGTLITTVLYFLCGVGSLVYAARKLANSDGWMYLWRYVLLLLWLFLPITCLLFISMFVAAFHDRYLITTLPALSILAAIGLVAINRKYLRLAAVTLLVLLSVYNLVGQYDELTKRDWRSATTLVLSKSEPGDAVLFYSWMAKYPFEYYYRRARADESWSNRLNCVWPSPFLPPSDKGNVRAHIDLVTEYGDPTPAQLEALAASHDRLWVVLAMDNIEGMGMHSGPLVSQLDEHFQTREAFSMERINIIRFGKAAK